MANFTGLGNLEEFFADSVTIQILIKIVGAIVIILVGFIIGRIVGKIILKILHEIELNAIIRKVAKTKINIEKGISVFAAYLVYFITIVMVLNFLGLATTILHILIGGIIILIVFSILIGIKDFIPNAFAGFSFLRKGELKIGDRIRFKGMEGRIVRITLTEIVIENKDDENIHIPTSALSKTDFTILKPKKKKKK